MPLKLHRPHPGSATPPGPAPTQGWRGPGGRARWTIYLLGLVVPDMLQFLSITRLFTFIPLFKGAQALEGDPELSTSTLRIYAPLIMGLGLNVLAMSVVVYSLGRVGQFLGLLRDTLGVAFLSAIMLAGAISYVVALRITAPSDFSYFAGHLRRLHGR